MIIIDKTLVSDDLKEVLFACDLGKCKGACCVEGDAGAPLGEMEISLLEDHMDDIIPFMVPEGIAEVKKNGVFDYDPDGNFVTPLVHGKECVFVYFEDRHRPLCHRKSITRKKRSPLQSPSHATFTRSGSPSRNFMMPSIIINGISARMRWRGEIKKKCPFTSSWKGH